MNFWINILKRQTNKEKKKKTNMVLNLKTIEISIKIKSQIILTRKLSRLSIHVKLRKINLDNVVMDFDATSLNPFAIWDEISVYPNIETGFAFEPHMNIVFVEPFNNQTFTKMAVKAHLWKTY